MNEVEKMYKLANVKAINIAEYGSTYIPNSVEIDGKLYPPFTAEKQLELIKWLGSKCGLFIVDKYSIGALVGEYVEEYCTKKNFENALAGTINSLWQDLTEEERKQIKEILE